MKHIKFEFAEPLVAIQRVRNEVFLGDDNTLWVLSKSVKEMIQYYLRCEDIPAERKLRKQHAYYRIGLADPNLQFVADVENDEIIVMKGQDRIWVENELGEDVTPPSDLDIDEGYEEMCNRVGCDYL